MPDFATQPMALSVAAHGRGSLDVLGEILATPGFAKVVTLPLDPKTTRGQFDGDFVFRTKLPPVYDPRLASIDVNAKVDNFFADHLVGKAGLEQGSLVVSLLGGVTHVNGTGKLFGAPATLEFTRGDDQPAKGTISFPMDEAARVKAGLNFGTSRRRADRGQDRRRRRRGSSPGPGRAGFRQDWAHLSRSGPVQARRAPAKSTFTYREDERGSATLDDFVFDGVGQSARGMLQFGADGVLTGARLAQVKFSPGDNLQIDAIRTGDGITISARGAAVDARPFLRNLTDSDTGGGPSTDFDLDLRSTLLTGANRQIISNAELRFAKKGGQFQTLNLAGKLGSDAVKGALTRPDSGPPLFRLTTTDGGELLAFLDFYTHMEGGALSTDLRLANGGFSGSLDIENFVLRGEPALRSFANAPNAGPLTSKVKLDPNAVSFSASPRHATEERGPTGSARRGHRQSEYRLDARGLDRFRQGHARRVGHFRACLWRQQPVRAIAGHRPRARRRQPGRVVRP